MTNAYDSTRGNNTDRQRRKLWLLETYRADVDVVTVSCNGVLIAEAGPIQLRLVETFPHRYQIVGEPEPACRCYRCGTLLTYETLTVDRIKPGCKGGRYTRNNIRPSCSSCATVTGNELKAANRAQSQKNRSAVRSKKSG